MLCQANKNSLLYTKVWKNPLKKTDIKEYSKQELIGWLTDHRISPYRANQILKWVYLRQADSFDLMSDISKETRSLFLDHFTIGRLERVKVQVSEDHTRKYLLRLQDGHHVECVLIPEKDHYTLCVSTQVGCAQGCRFCLTAKNGFVRNLTTGEILAQIRDVQHHLLQETENPFPLSNLVFMGMGEPLANFDNLIRALSIITDTDYGMKFSTRRVTISTAGLAPMIPRLGEATRTNLAISLNATNNKTRDLIMPINQRFPLEILLETLKRYPLSPRQKITIEYILIKGVNDSMEDAKRLTRLLAPIKAKVNLIPFNEHEGCDFRRPGEEVIHAFMGILLDRNFTAIVRKSKGQDISAACGQLSAKVVGDQAMLKPSADNEGL